MCRGLLVLALLCAAAAAEKVTKKMYKDMSEEELKKAEELKGVARCASCEEMVAVVEKEMAKFPKNEKSSIREVKAIELLERVCETSDNRLYCEEAVEKLEDELIPYIKKGVKVKDYNETVCIPCCSWKSDLRNSIADMNKNFVEKVKADELAKQKAELEAKQALFREKREKMTFSERFAEAWGLVMADLEGWWLTIFVGSFFLFIVLLFLQIFCTIYCHRRRYIKKRMEQLRKEREAAEHAKHE